MTSTLLAPPLTAPSDLQAVLKTQGFAVVASDAVSALSGVTLAELLSLNSFWNALPPDQYLKDGGRYRRRRHASFLVRGGVVSQYAHRAHWQPLSYNALHGGMLRWFEPLDGAMTSTAAWPALISFWVALPLSCEVSRPGLSRRIRFALTRPMALVGPHRKVRTETVWILWPSF